MRVSLIETYDAPPRVTTVASPECPADGALIEVRACGVCRSDHHAWKGLDPDVILPHVGGHEFAGVIIETGPNCTAFKIGDRVTAPFILGCGTCPDCLAGDATICATQEVIGFTFWGAFAERIAIPHADFNLVHLPENLGFVEAAAMGCRLTTAYRALTERAHLKSGEWLSIHGAGGVGLSAVMVGKALGAKVLAIDINEQSLERARRLGADATLNVSDTLDIDALREITGGGAHVSIDALGITATFQNSIAGLRKLGRHVQVGMPLGPHATVALPLLEQVYSRQISIIGSRGMAASAFPSMLEMVRTGAVKPRELVGRTIALDELGDELINMSSFAASGIAVIDDFGAH